MVKRVYVEKKPGFDVEARQLTHELRDILGMERLTGVRILNRYDVEGIQDALFDQCVPTVFSEPQVDIVYAELPQTDGAVFGVEYLPGQFDQRAASASECIQLISQGERPEVRSAKIYLLEGDLTQEDIDAIKHYVVNPVEARIASLDLPATLAMQLPVPDPVEILTGFNKLDDNGLAEFIAKRGLAMDVPDAKCCQAYFSAEGRDPSLAEIKVIDTYWSDHCRHTTFGTHLENVVIDDPLVEDTWNQYLAIRHELNRDSKPLCLMDMATIGARWLKKQGILTNLDESDEINACTVKVKVDVNGKDEDWLYLFKNETHNHPTEIEPFGGAATCVGGAIRDPLSGRSYVYQAMRVTGAANPLTPVSETLPHKLPQRKLVTTAAAGYSSYGNQIGLATGQVNEVYHPGYVAKRMEIGAVVGATPQDHVRREEPAAGDVIILLGGRTGRDGIGGATGSSKAHNAMSLESCGAEVQKGNPPVERKIQRLFRRKDACTLIKRCNDFGAGGVSVAIGELADGIFVELDKVPKKYDGLDGCELTISESQERMAVAVDARDAQAFLDLAREENLEATIVATVTDDSRVRMVWRGDEVVNLTREFLSSNGAPKHMNVHVTKGSDYHPLWEGSTFAERFTNLVSDLNVCGNKGLVERFDSTIGAATVLMPFGGERQLTPALAMVAKFPVDGETNTCSGMAWGFNPYLSSADPFAGAYLAVIESISKLIATGFKRSQSYFTYQEYFEKLRDVPERWGKPMCAVLGALKAQLDLGVASIGGKDSMSGSYENLDVPPTLVSFATAVGSCERIVSPEFKAPGSRVICIMPKREANGLMPKASAITATLDCIESLITEDSAYAISTAGFGGLAEALFKMCLGNRIGFEFNFQVDINSLFDLSYGSFIIEFIDDAQLPQSCDDYQVIELGTTLENYDFITPQERISLDDLEEAWAHKLEDVFPYRGSGQNLEEPRFVVSPTVLPKDAAHFAQPRVAIPVFPGTNCEYDTAHSFERAGANPQVFVINNLDPAAVAESTHAFARLIKESQIIMLPGGFSGGDEPDGSAKFITAFFRAPEVTEAVRDLLNNRNGLMLGICNGFQALIKLGLVPYGDIIEASPSAPTLTFNTLGRHQSRLVTTRIASTLSPWLANCNVDDMHTIAISHGEGRFVASDEVVAQLIANGQIATQYVDPFIGIPSMDLDINPNGSVLAIEGITSPDGRILGKMGHSERLSNHLYKNVPGNHNQYIFESGVAYFA